MQGEDDRLFSCRASKSPKPLWNYFRPHHWCFPLISFKQIFFSGECSYRFWVHFLRAGKPRPLWKTSQNRSTHSQLVACSLGRPMYASCQESHSQCTCEEELLFSHLNVEVTPGETTNLARWRGQDSPVSFTGLQTPSAFCLFQRTSPSCESFAGDRRYHQWEGGKTPGGISHFNPLPKPRWLWPRPRWSQYVWRGRTDSPLKPGALTDPLPHPPKQQGEGSISPPTPALQASLLLLCRPPVPHISPRHETPNEIMKSSGVCGAQLKVTAACEFTFKNN